jgi:hypothetical protein
MILEIDTQFLLDNKITAHQFMIAKLVSENKIPLLKKYILYTNTLNDIYKDLSQLKTAGFLSSTHKLGSIISFETINVSSKFLKAFSYSGDPFDELYALFPIKVLRPDGTYDYLRVDQDRCRKLYHNIVSKNPASHNNIMKCLKKEIEDRSLKGQMTYMKRMPSWLTSESWKAYDDRIEDNSNPTLGDKTKAYGNDIE